MERMILVDSSVFIRLMRQGKDPAIALLDHFDTLDLVTCGMVKLEVLRGVHVPAVKARLEAFVSTMMLVPSDNRLWDEAVELAWSLDRRGKRLPVADHVIAASALRVGAEVLSFDSHFAEIPKLPLAPIPDEWHRSAS